MLPTSAGNPSGTSLLGPSLLDGSSRDSFVSRSLADVAEVSAPPQLTMGTQCPLAWQGIQSCSPRGEKRALAPQTAVDRLSRGLISEARWLKLGGGMLGSQALGTADIVSLAFRAPGASRALHPGGRRLCSAEPPGVASPVPVPSGERVPCPSQVVDSQLACMMNENSVDYISRFNDLAQELSISEPGRREVLFDGSGGGPPIGDLSQ